MGGFRRHRGWQVRQPTAQSKLRKLYLGACYGLLCAGRKRSLVWSLAESAHWFGAWRKALIGLGPGAITGGGSETGGIPVDRLATGSEF